MNRWYGVRLPTSYRSESNWYAINRYGAIQMLWYGVALIFTGFTVIYVPPNVGSVWFFGALAAPALLTIPMLIIILRYSRRLP
ncbi:MAG: SdpI family protein [Candidatus Polarisedimenticolia bacterium]